MYSIIMCARKTAFLYTSFSSCVLFVCGHTFIQVSGVFVTYGVNAGASGAVLGLIGVLFVELFQFWQIVDRALIELLKLLGFVIFLLAVGTLPFIDNMAHIGIYTVYEYCITQTNSRMFYMQLCISVIA